MADCEHQEYQNQTDHLQQQQVLGVGTDEEIRQWLVEVPWKHWAEQCPRTRGNCSSTCPVIVITHALFNCIVLLYSIVSRRRSIVLTLHNNPISRWAACDEAKGASKSWEEEPSRPKKTVGGLKCFGSVGMN